MSTNKLQSLLVLGCSHHATPLEIRERIALDAEQIRTLQGCLQACPEIRESLVLATCNRLEVYVLASGKSESALKALREHLCDQLSIELSLLNTHAYTHQNLETIRHAFSVAAGLDSQLIGETEILGQMKQALATAQKENSTGSILNRLFEKSFQAAKLARTQTGIDKGQVSIGNVAVDLASRIFGKLEISRVLLIGSGEVGKRTAQALINRGVKNLYVTNRTKENAEKLATTLGSKILPYQDFDQKLPDFDIIISSTSAPEFILKANSFETTRRLRPVKPCFLIDLAMPRDIDPALDNLDNVYLYNLDDLSEIANENLARRSLECKQASTLLDAQAWQLWLQLRRRI
jgi:glutamyl-tRNA reductase